jgi:hypothetical protein
VRTPNPARQANGTLLSVSCAAATACTAVGSSYNGAGITTTPAETWNGARWAARVAPNPVGAAWSRLYAVSCGTPWTCIATGYYVSRAGTPLPPAERWNGAQWSIQATPDPAGAQASGLFGVSCPASRACTATGSFIGSSGSTMSLAERWNGHDWAIQAIASPAGATSSLLVAVSCTSSQACTAVGSSSGNSGAAGTLPLAEAWNGTRWSIEHPPRREGAVFSEFAAVSCPAPRACRAVGAWAMAPGQIGTLAEGWNGARWRIQSIPNPSGALISMLAAVSCATARACIAVGSYTSSSGATVAFAERWNGATWQVQAIPTPAGVSGSGLAAVSCITAQACTAVGSYTKGSGSPKLLAERWNGTSWSTQPIAAPAGTTAPRLTGVSCPATQACTAVGEVTSKGQAQPTPTPPGFTGPLGQPSLSAVSCPTATGCTATGNYTRGDVPAFFIEAWNGTHWRLRTAPTPPGTTSGALGGVSCRQTGCTAAGGYTGLTGVAVTLASPPHPEPDARESLSPPVYPR